MSILATSWNCAILVTHSLRTVFPRKKRSVKMFIRYRMDQKVRQVLKLNDLEKTRLSRGRMIRFLAHPLNSLVSKLSLFLSIPVCHRLSILTGDGEGRWWGGGGALSNSLVWTYVEDQDRFEMGPDHGKKLKLPSSSRTLRLSPGLPRSIFRRPAPSPVRHSRRNSWPTVRLHQSRQLAKACTSKSPSF